MNVKKKCVELKTSEFTTDRNAMLRSVEFLKAFLLGFDINDAIAFLRLDDLYMETFLIKDGNIFHNFYLIPSSENPQRRSPIQMCCQNLRGKRKDKERN